MFIDYALWIPLLPALGWLIITLFSRALGNRGSAWLATSLMALSAVLAIGVFSEVLNNAPVWNPAKLEQSTPLIVQKEKELKALEQPGQAELSPQAQALEEELTQLKKDATDISASSTFPFVREWTWLGLKGESGLPFGLYYDQLAAITVLMVSIVATLIHLFSIGYMAGEDRYPTFFAYINLFAAAMLAMVMSKNLFHVLLFWEIMGLMSYLLIGFFYKKRSAQQAQKKAFLTVRVGDLAFMAGLFWLYSKLGTLDLPTIIQLGQGPQLATALGGAAFGIGLLLFIAAVGKSAQFPLHVWLPDAMEGPTPVSAMIHAATMVAAGVYLVARAYPIMQAGNVMPVIAWIGGFTALFAATMAPAQADAKKIMAFSTLSQLGYMFLSLGVFGYTAAMFHLLTHAFFKALLFLGSGSMIHGAGTQDIFEMDNLAKYQKWTLGTVWVGALSLMGFPLFAGFWSKDEILHAALNQNFALYLVACATAILTAFYTTRMMIIAFYKQKTVSPWGLAPWNQQGEPTLHMSQAEVEEQNRLEHGHAHHGDHPHESGPEMIVPLVLLATLAMVMGFIGSVFANGWFQRFVYFGTPELIPLSEQLPGFMISFVLVALGIGGAVWMYWLRDHTVQMAPNWMTRILQRRYYIDDYYYASVAKIGYDLQFLLAWFDRVVVDGTVDLIGTVVSSIGDAARRVQTGAIGWYAGLTVAGAIVMVLAFAIAFAGGAK